MDLFSILNYYIKERATPRAPLREDARGQRVLHRPSAQEEVQDEVRDEKFRKNVFDVGRTEELCREMDKLANEDHTHHITPEEISVYRKQLVDPFEHSWF